MDSVHLTYPWMFHYNPTAAKCALGTALIVATLWAFLIKPLLRRYYFCRSTGEPKGAADGPHPRRTAPTSVVETTRRKKSSSQRRGRSAVREEAEHISTILRGAQKEEEHATAGVSSGARYVTPGASVTEEALATLFQSPEFVRWYELHRSSLLQRVRVRYAQALWVSMATLVVLSFGMFLLPFFSFRNEDATLWGLLQQRYGTLSVKTVSFRHVGQNDSHYRKDTPISVESVLFSGLSVYGERFLLLVTVLTLFTTAFMPAAATHAATTALVAFLVLFAEAALVHRVGVGAGFAALLAVVAWRVGKACKV